MEIRVEIGTTQPLQGTVAAEEGEEIGFEGWLELLEALSSVVHERLAAQAAPAKATGVSHLDRRHDMTLVNTPAQPTGQLDTRFSSQDAQPARWVDVATILTEAEIFWLSTVRQDGRPHVTPLLAVWMDGRPHFCTGPEEQKAKNLAHNPRCVLTTGANELRRGTDVVVEGAAVRVTDPARLERIASLYEPKYGSDWRFTVVDDTLRLASEELTHEAAAGVAWAYEVVPDKVLAFSRGDRYGQTRWRF